MYVCIYIYQIEVYAANVCKRALSSLFFPIDLNLPLIYKDICICRYKYTSIYRCKELPHVQGKEFL